MAAGEGGGGGGARKGLGRVGVSNTVNEFPDAVQQQQGVAMAREVYRSHHQPQLQLRRRG